MLLLLGKPLGWEEEYAEEPEKQREFLEGMELETYESSEGQECVKFSEVLESLFLLHMVRQEIQLHVVQTTVVFTKGVDT